LLASAPRTRQRSSAADRPGRRRRHPRPAGDTRASPGTSSSPPPPAAGGWGTWPASEYEQLAAGHHDLVKHLGRDATWRFTLACAFAWASQQLPMPTDNAVTHALLLLAAVGLGALVGKRLDRRKRHEPP
jgi:hypothetical protein